MVEVKVSNLNKIHSALPAAAGPVSAGGHVSDGK